MIETFEKEIDYLKAYVTAIKDLKKRKKMESRMADSRIETTRLEIKELQKEMKILKFGRMQEQRMKDIRKLAKKLGMSIEKLERELRAVRKEYSLKQIKKEFHPAVYKFFTKFKENAVYSTGPQPPTLGRHPATGSSPRAKAIAGWKTFQQLPVDREIRLDVADIPSRMTYSGPIEHLVYYGSKWSRLGGVDTDMQDTSTIVPENVDINYIHRWRKNPMHLLKHPDKPLYYIEGKCKVLDIGLDDSDFVNPPPVNGFDYEIPSHVAEIGKLVEIQYRDLEGKKKLLSFDSKSVHVCCDGEGTSQRLYLLNEG